MNAPLSPWDTVKSVVSSLSFSEALWVVVGIACVFLFYRIAISRGRREGSSWKAVLFWFISSVGWVFILHMVTWRKIVAGEFPATLMLVGSAIAVTVTVIHP